MDRQSVLKLMGWPLGAVQNPPDTNFVRPANGKESLYVIREMLQAGGLAASAGGRVFQDRS